MVKEVFISLFIGIVIYLVWNYYIYVISQKNPIIFDLKKTLEKIEPRSSQYNFYIGNKSYSINKKHIYLCLKDKDGKYYSKNTLVYVALHELAHCLNLADSEGHSPTFYNVFNNLLKKAAALGYWDPNIPIPTDYCDS